VDFSRSGRQADEIDGQAAEQLFARRGRGRLQASRRAFGQNEAVNRRMLPVCWMDNRQRRPNGSFPGPVIEGFAVENVLRLCLPGKENERQENEAPAVDHRRFALSYEFKKLNQDCNSESFGARCKMSW